MRNVTHVDRRGRKFMVQLPDDAPDRDASRGIVLGPPDLSGLGWPSELEVSIHNKLFDRGLITERDIGRRREEIYYVLMSALGADVDRIILAYKGD